MEYTESVKAGNKIIKILSNVLVHPVIVAQVLHNSPEAVRIKVWQTVKFLILHWKIDYNRGTQSVKAIDEWIKEMNCE